MYKRILVALDNSPYSEACSSAALSLARALGAEVVGCHAYAARMHERRFRQTEAALPGEYLVDKELERQRAIHDSLIALGLQLISDSYLDALERRCWEAEVPFSRKSRECSVACEDTEVGRPHGIPSAHRLLEHYRRLRSSLPPLLLGCGTPLAVGVDHRGRPSAH